MELKDYLIDPRPDLPADSKRWQRLLRIVFLTIKDADRAHELLSTLWTFRSFGLMLMREDDSLKFRPVIKDGWTWESYADYEYWRTKYLAPYVAEIKQLLRRLEQEGL
ncbi:hypothetical protein [Paenibacillus daejeonensis]|uniref:hypothetical protein n=1 Tax=Paenibacillus daejeonensis TaxID=135193 RepID=UPI00036A5492|nr:hypothetical protein [Paenibacillus daejeonensis]